MDGSEDLSPAAGGVFQEPEVLGTQARKRTLRISVTLLSQEVRVTGQLYRRDRMLSIRPYGGPRVAARLSLSSY